MIGVLGGLGPAATVDLMAKILALDPVQSEYEHVPLIAISDPRVPSLATAILYEGVSPVPVLTERVRQLERAGARAIVIACHAAHHWYDDLQACTRIPILHIATAAVDALRSSNTENCAIGLLAAESTLHSGFYQRALAKAGYQHVLPSAAIRAMTKEAIDLVKQGNAPHAANPCIEAIDGMHRAGASAVLLACTELPIALGSFRKEDWPFVVDTTAALARGCIAFYRQDTDPKGGNQ